MYYYVIYKIINLVNNKIYIGKHKTKNLDDGYMGSGTLLKKAIEKYGIENFKKEILFQCQSEEEMNILEKQLVNENFIKSNNNYNLTIGGKGTWKHATLKHQEQMKNIEYYNRYSNKMKQVYENQEIRNKISNSLKLAHIKNPDHFKNKKHTTNAINKMKDTFKKIHHQQGEKNSQYGTIWIYNDKLKKSKKIKKEDLNFYLNQGWLKGRKLKFG